MKSESYGVRQYYTRCSHCDTEEEFIATEFDCERGVTCGKCGGSTKVIDDKQNMVTIAVQTIRKKKTAKKRSASGIL